VRVVDQLGVAAVELDNAYWRLGACRSRRERFRPGEPVGEACQRVASRFGGCAFQCEPALTGARLSEAA
jgi:hypothetical protein